MALGIPALASRLAVVLAAKNALIVDLQAQLAAAQTNAASPEDIQALADINAFLTQEENPPVPPV